MIRKFYDTEYGISGGIYVKDTQDNEESVIVECECGSHHLKVTSDTTLYTNSDGTMQANQTIYLAMFQYGSGKRPFWERLKIALKYLRTDKMFSDQLSLTPDEARQMTEFLHENIIIKRV